MTVVILPWRSWPRSRRDASYIADVLGLPLQAMWRTFHRPAGREITSDRASFSTQTSTYSSWPSHRGIEYQSTIECTAEPGESQPPSPPEDSRVGSLMWLQSIRPA